MGLDQYTTPELLEEIVRRVNEAERDEITLWCHDCANFATKPDADHKYNPCTKKHRMKFIPPVGYSDITNGEYGFYRTACKDRE